MSDYLWAIGIEHETQMIYFPLGMDIKSYDIMKLENVCDYMLKNWSSLHNFYIKQKGVDKKLINKIFSEKNFNFIQEIMVRKFEQTGRKCNGKFVIKPVYDKNNKVVKMPEFVSDSPFKKLPMESYCNQIIDQQNRFTAIIAFHPSIRKKALNNFTYIPFPFGMSNYIKCDNKLFRDYTGSFHITLTLPFTRKTSNERFIQNHTEFANLIQWIEPLLVPAFFSGDDKSIGSKENRVKGPFRVTCTGWGNFAGSDIRKFKEGVGRLTNHKNNWRKKLNFYKKEKTNYCSKVSKLVQLREPAAVSGFSSDFRTFGGEEHISGYGMSKPNGVELRIFDNIHTIYTSRLCRLLVYVAERSRNRRITKYVYTDKDWIESLHNIVNQGWKGLITRKYLNKLRNVFDLELKTNSLRAWDVLNVFNEELFNKTKNGLWTKLLLKKKYTKPTELICINRCSLESGFILKLNNNITIRRKLIKFYNELPEKVKFNNINNLFFKIFDKSSYKNHIEDIIFFLETIKCIKVSLEKGSIKEITKEKCDINKVITLSNLSDILRKQFEKALTINECF